MKEVIIPIDTVKICDNCGRKITKNNYAIMLKGDLHFCNQSCMISKHKEVANLF